MQQRRDPTGSDGDAAQGASDEAAQRPTIAAEQLLTPGDVAEMFGVSPKTVARWAEAGKLEALRTLGGHRRYRVAEVARLRQQAAG